jgi:hypothetical protein
MNYELYAMELRHPSRHILLYLADMTAVFVAGFQVGTVAKLYFSCVVRVAGLGFGDVSSAQG